MLEKYKKYMDELKALNKELALVVLKFSHGERRAALKQLAIRWRQETPVSKERDEQIQRILQLWLKTILEPHIEDYLASEYTQSEGIALYKLQGESRDAFYDQKAIAAHGRGLAACADAVVEDYRDLTLRSEGDLRTTKKLLLLQIAHRLRDEKDGEKLDTLFAFFISPETLPCGKEAKLAYDALVDTIQNRPLGEHWNLDRVTRFLAAIPKGSGASDEDRERYAYLVRGFMRIYIHYSSPSKLVGEVELVKALLLQERGLSPAAYAFLGGPVWLAQQLDVETMVLRGACMHLPEHDEPDEHVHGTITFTYQMDGSIVLSLVQDDGESIDEIDAQEGRLVRHILDWQREFKRTVHLEWRFANQPDGEPTRRTFAAPQ